ncbi:PEP/pyruvate-binding domain-containing protein [Nocardia sp. NPDC059239]|uniref:PEP/pyruvate-binding domain-containing protein n=1 Tax=unclassified Nocardia TaxID=2637762 RepID=UPI0036B2B3CA
MEHIVSIAECNNRSRHQVGGKAVGLAAMSGLGLNVPTGFVITTDAYRSCVNGDVASHIEAILRSGEGLDEVTAQSARIAELFTADLITEDVRASILDAYTNMSNGEPAAVAVRSSATAEDLADASFAGQQDTYLWVKGVDSVLENVVRCWASLFTAQVIQYRQQLGVVTDDLAMGVIVQAMVPADVAGVMMTLDPATGDRSSVYVEAAYGLGEGVVKGDVTSDSYWASVSDRRIIRSEIRGKDTAHRYSEVSSRVEKVPVEEADRHRPALSPAELALIAGVGLTLQEALGAPQDVEWAMVGEPDSDRELFLLQTRAETVWSNGSRGTRATAQSGMTQVDLDEPTMLHGHAARDGLWTVTNMQESIPGVETPMTWSVWLPVSEHVNRNHFRFLGALSRTEALIPSSPQDWIVGVFYGRAALRVDLLAEWADRVPGMSGAELIGQFFSTVPGGMEPASKRRYHPRSLLRTPLPFLVVPRRMRANRSRVDQFWRTALEELQTSDARRTIEILDEAISLFTTSLALQVNLTMGAFHTTAKMLRRIASATDVSAHEIVAGYGGHEESALVEDMWLCSRDRLTLDEFLARHGFHGWREGELSNKSWREDPSMVISQIAQYRSRPDSDDPRLSSVDRISRRRRLERELLASLPRRRHLHARFVLAMSRHYLPMRGVSKAAFMQALDVVRASIRRSGEFLVASGEIANVEDVFYLTVDEIRDLHVPGARDLVRARRALRERYETIDVPDAWRGMPTPVVAEPDEVIGAISGTPASPGIVEGIARVVLDPAQAIVEEGEILFARDTDPAWASLMFLSAALVADIGGVMSHAAVVARELGIPCVVNTKSATRHICTGDRVRIDGAAGTIQILERRSASARSVPA